MCMIIRLDPIHLSWNTIKSELHLTQIGREGAADTVNMAGRKRLRYKHLVHTLSPYLIILATRRLEKVGERNWSWNRLSVSESGRGQVRGDCYLTLMPLGAKVFSSSHLLGKWYSITVYCFSSLHVWSVTIALSGTNGSNLNCLLLFSAFFFFIYIYLSFYFLLSPLPLLWKWQ